MHAADPASRVPPGVVEELAAIEHERWSHWQRYLHSRCSAAPDGSLTIPAELAQEWTRQLQTPYAGLSEAEKDSDREQVARYLPVVERLLDEVVEGRG